MADQCIICLEPLEAADEVAATPAPLASGTQQLPQDQQQQQHQSTAENTNTLSLPKTTTQQNVATAPDDSTGSNVAKIEACGHLLHDACLREWNDKANSCPICRQVVHTVTVYDKVGGMFD
jgi:hemolysin activation/secretion protein